MINSSLEGLLEKSPDFNTLVERLAAGSPVNAQVPAPARAYFLASLSRALKQTLLIIEPGPDSMKQLQEQLDFWLGQSGAVAVFPEPDALPFEPVKPDSVLMRQRVGVLNSLAQAEKGGPRGRILLTSAGGLLRKVPPRSLMAGSSFALEVGSEAEPSSLVERLVAIGYDVDQSVEVPGAVARRGGIIDVFSPNNELPARIEFDGNRIESIRWFDPLTQRSVGKAESLSIIPPNELFSTGAGSTAASGGPVADATLFDYLPDDALAIIDSPGEVQSSAEELAARWEELRRQAIAGQQAEADGPLPYVTPEELNAAFGRARQLRLVRWDTQGAANPAEAALTVGFGPVPAYVGQLDSFIDNAARLARDGARLLVVSQQSARLAELFADRDIGTVRVDSLQQPPEPGRIMLVRGSLPGGWSLGRDHESLHLFTDAELFGVVKQQRFQVKRPVKYQSPLSGISAGDYVVHVDHGIGRFSGMRKMTVNDAEQDYLVVEYSNGDKLYVPSEQVDRLTRYIGSTGVEPALSRLGGTEWARIKERVKEQTAKRAQELLALYASRQAAEGFVFKSAGGWQQELEASFPYVETPDQVRAMQEIEADMERAKPMDRLICGDVGYGKTELALRAAFKAVMSGKQVAFLVPTTVLAQQHYSTFTQRLNAFPVTVEVLSRFRSDKEQKAVIDAVAGGSIDIIIGTHRLLQKDVVFKDLGLVIIDEEQRFGVSHKEYFKDIRKEVDVLTLSATPIPRTMHMSLVGIRDMSIMETPPEERLPVKTWVSEYDTRVIREAILREIERGGQVFFVHNRVETIFALSEQLQKLVPEARIAVAHGQMTEDKLEAVMTSFSEGEVDVLVCTTIVESGLDIPNANTLIVSQADRMGLAQLYQLRGRVGRSSQRAYAYFFHKKGAKLTPNATRRLETIFEATDLGAGFQIATRDLEIRGAGNLLGVEQSGNVNSVGFELYCQLLTEAVAEVKARQEGKKYTPPSEVVTTTVTLPIDSFLPEHYVSDLKARLSFYLRLSRLTSLEGLEEARKELTDRYGAMPEEAENLMFLVKIRLLGMRAGLKSVQSRDGRIVCELGPGARFSPTEMKRIFRYRILVRDQTITLDMAGTGERFREVLEDLLNHLGDVRQGADASATVNARL